MLNCLLRVIKQHDSTNIEDSLSLTSVSLSKSEEKVLNALREDNKLTIAKISQLTGLSVSGVKKIINALKVAGLLERKGSSKSGEWIIK